MTVTQAMILAAGRGERMQPLTRHRAKPSLPVLGLPLVTRIARHLAQSGIDRFAVNAHHHPASIEAALRQGVGPGATVELFVEREQLMGSGGSLAQPRRFLAQAEWFVLHNGDTLLTAPIEQLRQAATQPGCAGALLARPGRTPGLEGAIAVVDGMFVDRVRGAAALDACTVPLFTYLGVALLHRSLLEFVPTDRPSDLFGDLLMPFLSHGNRLAVVEAHGPWLEFTSPQSYLDNTLRAIGSALPAGEGAAICSRASVSLAARFDGRVVIEADAIVEAGTFLRRSMILEGAHVSTGTVLEDVVVDRGVQVRGGHYRRGCLVADQTHSGAIELVPFATSGS